MDSPERTCTIPSMDDLEGSPLFNFLCTLSPIKPIKSIHISQPFSEISFPAPPSVFVSPRADRQKCFELKQGAESKNGCEEGNTNPKCIYVATAKRVQKLGNNSIACPTSSPSKLMQEYLVSSIQDEQNMVNYSPDMLMCDDIVEAKHADEAANAVECKSSLRLELDKSVSASMVAEDILFSEQKFCWVKNEQNNEQKISLANASQGNDDDDDDDSPQLGLVMTGEVEKSQLHRRMADWHARVSPSTLSMEQMERYITSLKGVMDEGQENKSTEQSTKSSPTLDGKENGSKVNASVLRGARRRCLDFEVLENNVKTKASISASISISQENQINPTDPLTVLRERASSVFGVTNSTLTQNVDAHIKIRSRAGVLDAVITSPRSTKPNLSAGAPSKNTNQMNCPMDSSPFPMSMPSGIGLHLNSIESLPLHQTNNSDSSIALIQAQQKNLDESLVDNSTNIVQQDSLTGEAVISILERTGMEECEAESECPESVLSSSKTITYSRSITLGIKRVTERSEPDKRASLLGRKRVLLSELPHPMDLERPDECSQSPKKRRRLSSAEGKSGDGCKRCNCKKSKCLKLYCECFAAGVYCVGSCTCQGCVNRPEFEDVVMETRQQIESRNPLAFAPKIMMAAEPSPSNKEDCPDSAASARHKRGCNCKKSRCLKKYCECYQAGVGCSDGCRCENCENIHGRKQSAEVSEEKDNQVETGEKENEEQMHASLDCSDECINDGFQLQNAEMSPITPSEYKSQNRNITKAKRSTASRRRFTPEELQSPISILSASARQPKSPLNLSGSSNGAQSNSPAAPDKTLLLKVESSPISTPQIMHFSPRWHGSNDICTITPLPQAPLRPAIATPISGIHGTDSSPSMNEHVMVSSGTNTNRSFRSSCNLIHQLTSPIPEHHHCQSARYSSSAQSNTPFITLSGTPATPLPPNVMGEDVSSCPKEPVEKKEETDPRFVGLEMLELFTGHEFGRSPICLSPKHKRVSPPQYRYGLRETLSSHRELQSPSSTNRRKFILKSIPSTPSSAAHQ